MAVDIASVFEDRFLPQLEVQAGKLREEFPEVLIRVYGVATGSKTDLQGHGVFIDCILPDVPADRPDNVGLGISLAHITTTPVVLGADVCWSHPSGQVEAELPLRESPWGDEAARAVEQGLPGLVAALREAIRRGHPSG